MCNLYQIAHRSQGRFWGDLKRDERRLARMVKDGHNPRSRCGTAITLTHAMSSDEPGRAENTGFGITHFGLNPLKSVDIIFGRLR
jgi:hypothetical protein